MTAKKEYKEALNRLLTTYNSSDLSMSARRRFNDDLELLYELVNERFGEKEETNLEHYNDFIIDVLSENLALVNGAPVKCEHNCSCCDLDNRSCGKDIRKWIGLPYRKPMVYKLTPFEFDLINTYSDCDSGCKLTDCKQLLELKEKGYFKDINKYAKIHDILRNCEVNYAGEKLKGI